jgi:acyl-CoA thioester hydrolase
MANSSEQFSIDIRVPYADTDQMGVVYYANYLVYFERGRTEWLRHKGISYKELEAQGIFFPVVEAVCNYKAPARYDDLITVRTALAPLGVASALFQCEVLRDGVLLASGHTKHLFVDTSFKPTRIPAALRSVLEGKGQLH